MGYDHQKATDINGKFKNFSQNNSKEQKSPHDKYEKATRSHMNQLPASQMGENAHFVPQSDQRSQMLQIQQQQAHNGNRAFTQQNFYGQGDS